MDFRYTPEHENFRVRLRTWLERNRVEVFGDGSDPLNERDEDSDSRWKKMLEWHRRLHEAGYVAWVAPQFPLTGDKQNRSTGDLEQCQ